MTAFSKLQDAWQAVEQRFMTSPPIQRLGRGDLTLAHYGKTGDGPRFCYAVSMRSKSFTDR